MASTDDVRRHYAQPALTRRIFEALAATGVDTRALTPADLASFDQFHIGGRDATVDLARLAGLRPGARVLDVGCGIGGPARTLAVEFGCRVHGVDLVPESVAAARALTEAVGLTDAVSFETADACALPFDDGRFDAVWSQHALVNAPDKARIVAEAHRVLAPGGVLALHEVFAGPAGPPVLPLPWASDAATNFLVPIDELREVLTAHGLARTHDRDVTAAALRWFRDTLAAATAAPGAGTPGPPRPSLRLLMGPDAAQKSKNVIRNLEEKRVVVAMLVEGRP